MGEQAAGALAMAQLSEAAARAREFEAFHRLTSFVIHDIKNTVASLSLLSRNALDNFDDPEFQRDAIRTISISVARMRRLLARLSAPSASTDLSFEAVDLGVVAREAAAVVPHPPTVHVAVEANSAVVRGDMDALVRVVENLVKNAVEAINGDGAVVIRVHREHEACILSVTDTGQGIPEDFLRGSLFVPFRSTKPGGWGVGLYQVKELVEKHGGTVAVTSRVGAGTTFTIRLTAAAQRTDTVLSKTAVSTGGR
jgi:putative PEP-CTERM system histidine kinase